VRWTLSVLDVALPRPPAIAVRQMRQLRSMHHVFVELSYVGRRLPLQAAWMALDKKFGNKYGKEYFN